MAVKKKNEPEINEIVVVDQEPKPAIRDADILNI